MKRFNVYEDSDARESTSGGWVLYSEASERIASLEVQLAQARECTQMVMSMSDKALTYLAAAQAERDEARADAQALRAVTPEMVKIYLTANSEYWRSQDVQACPPLRWRNGTQTEATEYALTTMFAAIDAARSAMPGSAT